VPSTTPSDNERTTSTGKGRATPSRKAAEAARKRPLVPKDRKLAARQDREAAKAARDREYRALKTGDERYLPARDKGPERRWVRDYVDARRNLAEWFLPFALLGFIAPLGAQSSAALYLGMIVVLYLGIVAGVIDSLLLARSLGKGLQAKFGRLPRGARMYGVLRAVQMRRMRMPKPQVARGQFPS
jgi:hypothetical protein